MTTIGMIGLGAMGLPMATHIATAHPGKLYVTARDQSAITAALDAGAIWCETPADLTQHIEVLVTVLPDLPQLREVLESDQGVLSTLGKRELLVVVCSTSSPVGVQDYAAELTERTGGTVRLVDAPLSGGTEGAQAGTLSIMVGGDEADAQCAINILDACGTPVHLGPLGAGEVAKACNQLIVAATVMAVGEASALAARSGIELTRMFDLLGGGYAGSRILETKAPRMAAEDYEGGGMAQYMLKDLGFVQELAQATHTNTVLGAPLMEAFEQLTQQGLGEKDICVTRKFIEER